MVLNYGGFKFKWYRLASMSLNSDFGIAKCEILKNSPSFFSVTKPHTSLKLSATSLPIKDGTNSLKELYALAKSQKAYVLSAGNGKYYGKFVIVKIEENRSSFSPNGGFLAQNFTLELERVE